MAKNMQWRKKLIKLKYGCVFFQNCRDLVVPYKIAIKR